MLCSEVRNAIRISAHKNGISWRHIIATMREMPPPVVSIVECRRVEVIEETHAMNAVHAAWEVAAQFPGKR